MTSKPSILHKFVLPNSKGNSDHRDNMHSACTQSTFAENTLMQNIMMTSMHVQEECAKVGFDWPNYNPVFDKVEEEIAEIKEAINNPKKSQQDVQEEMGDLLFACINLCRHLSVNPEQALIQANAKFVKRFQLVESMLEEAKIEFADTNLQTLEDFWQKAKHASK